MYPHYHEFGGPATPRKVTTKHFPVNTQEYGFFEIVSKTESIILRHILEPAGKCLILTEKVTYSVMFFNKESVSLPTHPPITIHESEVNAVHNAIGIDVRLGVVGEPLGVHDRPIESVDGVVAVEVALEGWWRRTRCRGGSCSGVEGLDFTCRESAVVDADVVEEAVKGEFDGVLDTNCHRYAIVAH